MNSFLITSLFELFKDHYADSLIYWKKNFDDSRCTYYEIKTNVITFTISFSIFCFQGLLGAAIIQIWRLQPIILKFIFLIIFNILFILIANKK